MGEVTGQKLDGVTHKKWSNSGGWRDKHFKECKLQVSFKVQQKSLFLCELDCLLSRGRLGFGNREEVCVFARNSSESGRIDRLFNLNVTTSHRHT